MAAIYDPVSHLTIGDPQGFFTLVDAPPSYDEVTKFSQTLIVSSSGWRMVFAASGDEEDPGEDILPEAGILAGAMAESFADYMCDTVQKAPKELSLVLALDSRPTGPALADAMLRVFLSRGIQIHYLFIASAPEAMAYARQNPNIDGFCYISASHNPIGHNGVKFGLSNGGVLGGDQAKNLISRFMSIRERPDFPTEIFQEMKKCPKQLLEKVFHESHKHKNQSLTYYRDFTNQVVADSDDSAMANQRIHNLRHSVQKNRIGILAELNGSARTLTIDRQYLEDLGVTIQVVNGVPRQITHRIVPEGRSLDLCKSELEKAFSKDPCFQLGYVPDNDGDRGNLVYLNPSTGKAKQIEAQEIFALTVMAELAWLVVSGQLSYDEHGRAHQRVAVAVNGPTSMRIEEVCRAFDVDVFRAEVGEANVVTLAHNLRKKGYLVRILGEGSNGGNITHPSSVRDPLNTICSLLKVLTMRGDSNAHTLNSSLETPAHMGLFQIYCKKIGQAYSPDFTIQDVLQSLPAYTTTSAYEDRAILRISTTSHAVLKQRYEKRLRHQWPEKAPLLKKKLGIETWRVINYEGIQERVGMGPEYRTGDQRGGFKIVFKDEKGQAIAFIWMRGSGTEPVFRVLADLRGDNPEMEDYLLQWHKSMIQEADKE